MNKPLKIPLFLFAVTVTLMAKSDGSLHLEPGGIMQVAAGIDSAPGIAAIACDVPFIDVQILDEYKNLVVSDENGASNFLPNRLFYIRMTVYCPSGIGTLYSFVNNAADNGPLQPGAHAYANCDEIAHHSYAICDFGPYNIGLEPGPRPLWVHAATTDCGVFEWNANGWASKASWETGPDRCPYPNVISEPLFSRPAAGGFARAMNASQAASVPESDGAATVKSVSGDKITSRNAKGGNAAAMQAQNTIAIDLGFEVFSPGF
ncbi:hypothetical protein OH491_19250 [Termitidicoccus mucosus]